MTRECGCIVVGDFKQAAPGRKKRCGTERRGLIPNQGDEMKADAAPPPLAAHEGKKKGATKKSVRGRKEKKSNDYAQKKVIP